ncbi:F0F1 ATP synthase subunit A [bacterium]|nr:F0F1 ATP synthase subunit A [bacterium]
MIPAILLSESGHEVVNGAEHVAHEGGHHIPELPNWFVILKDLGVLNLSDQTQLDLTFITYSFLVMAFILIWVWLAKKGLAMRPTSRLYIATEMFFGGVRDFFGSVLGSKEVNRHIWLVGTLFIYILCMNLNGMVPGGFAPSSSLGMNLGMAVIVFLYVIYVGISRNGLWKWFHHLLGSPSDGITWGMTPLFFILNVLEEFIRPISLSLRLFGNILGKDILLGVFVGLITIPIIGWFKLMIPLHWPFLFLALLLSIIQALIFSILSAVYILLVLPHGDEHQ